MRRILLLPDVPNWALHNLALGIQKYSNLNVGYEIKFWCLHNFTDFRNYDLIWASYKTVAKSLLEAGFKNVCVSVHEPGVWDQGASFPGFISPPPTWVIDICNLSLGVSVDNKQLHDLFLKFLPKQRLFVTRLAADPDIFGMDRPISGNKLTFGFCGNTKLERKRYDVYQTIKNELRKEFNWLEREQDFEELQNQEILREFYNRLDILLITSRVEGGPLPLIEAAMCGRIVISSKVGLAPEFIRSGINGFLVNLEPSHYISLLKRILNKEYDLNQISCEAQKTALLEFSWPQVIEQWDFFLESCLNVAQAGANQSD